MPFWCLLGGPGAGLDARLPEPAARAGSPTIRQRHQGTVIDSVGVATLGASHALASDRLWATIMCDVLILEDDPLVRLTFADILADEGFIVREAGSVAVAWAILHEPAGARVLLADKELGGPVGEPDGFAMAVEALRLYPALVVVYASALPHALDGYALTTREHVLPKPFMPEALVALVRKIISERQKTTPEF